MSPHDTRCSAHQLLMPATAQGHGMQRGHRGSGAPGVNQHEPGARVAGWHCAAYAAGPTATGGARGAPRRLLLMSGVQNPSYQAAHRPWGLPHAGQRRAVRMTRASVMAGREKKSPFALACAGWVGLALLLIKASEVST